MKPATRFVFFSAIAFTALTALSGDAWSRARHMQREIDHTYSLRTAQRELSLRMQEAGDTRSLEAALESLLEDPALGFRFLALRDRAGSILAASGRFEDLGGIGLRADVMQQVREALYALTSKHGYLQLAAPQQTLELEWALGAPQREQHDEAVARLSRFGSLGLFCGLTGLVALIYFLRLRERSGLPERLRDAPRLRSPTPARDSAAELLNLAGIGLMRLDRLGRVLAMNAMAEQWTGWTEQSAIEQQIFTVLRVRDDEHKPLDATLAAAWQGGATTPIQLEGWLMPRQGERLRMEVRAATLRDAGGITGAVLVLNETSHHYAQGEQLAQAARLPQSLMDRLDEAILHTDTAGVIRYANERIRDLLGYPPDELQGESIGKLLPVPFLNQPQLSLKDYAAHKPELPAVTGWHKDGRSVPIELGVEPLPVEGGFLVILRTRADAQAN